jgi:hypothetical protein
MMTVSDIFKFPPMLSASHEREFSDRAIGKDFALADGYRTIADNESRALGFDLALPLDQRNNGMQGILIQVGGSNGDGTPRLKPDIQPLIGGKPVKYLSRKGDISRLFEPHTNRPEDKTDPSIDLMIVESPFKASSIAENVIPLLNRHVAVVGLQGINTGWLTPKNVVATPDGGHEKVKAGPPALNPDLAKWELQGRRLWICFDSDVTDQKHVQAYLNSKASGAIGTEATLVRLLKSAGADPWIIELPNESDGSKNGPDDFIKRHNADAFVERMRQAVKARDINVLLARSLIRPASDALKPQPDTNWIIQDMIQPGTVNADVGDAGTLKTYANIDKCVCIAMGADWQNKRTRQTRVLIVDEESGIPRLPKRIGDTMRGHNAPSNIPLGYVSLLGLNLRLPKDLDRLRALIEAHEAGFVLIDSWAAVVAGADENAVSEIQPVLINLRRIAERTRCAFQLIHHTNRNGGYRGSTAFKAALDLMMISERRLGNELVFTCEKARDAVVDPFSARAHFELGKFYLEPLDSPAAFRMNPSEAYVYRFLQDRISATVDEIVSGADICSEQSARRAIYSLAGKSILKRIDTGGQGKTATYELVKNSISQVGSF